jgi:hypothetical protein
LMVFNMSWIRFCLLLLIMWINSKKRIWCGYSVYIFFFPVGLQPNAGYDLILKVSTSHITTHHIQ